MCQTPSGYKEFQYIIFSLVNNDDYKIYITQENIIDILYRLKLGETASRILGENYRLKENKKSYSIIPTR